VSGLQVREDARGAGGAPKAATRNVQAPARQAPVTQDRLRTGGTAPTGEADRVADLVKQVEAKQVEAEQTGSKPAEGAAPQQARDGAGQYLPPGVQRPFYTGGAPALKPEQMDQAVVQNNLLLRGLYALEDKAPWLLRAYQGITRVAGPVGAWLNVGYNAYSLKRIMSDPKAPALYKAGVVGSTGLAGVSALAATRVGLHAFNVWPMAAEGAKLMGKVAGVTGLGAATILSAMDTYAKFKDPNATAAEKGFSTLATASSAGLTAAVLLGVTGPVGIALGIGAVAFTLLGPWLKNNKIANAVFEGIGSAASAVGGALKSAGSAIVGGVKKIFSGW